MKLAELYRQFNDTKTEKSSAQKYITNYLNTIKNMKKRKLKMTKKMFMKM